MDDLSRTRTEPLPAAPEASEVTSPRRGSSSAAREPCPGARICAVCGKEFVARRPEARACSGRCRMHASRARRVADLVARIEAAEHCIAEHCIKEAEAGLDLARVALAGLRELASLGASKVMP